MRQLLYLRIAAAIGIGFGMNAVAYASSLSTSAMVQASTGSCSQNGTHRPNAPEVGAPGRTALSQLSPARRPEMPVLAYCVPGQTT